MRFLLMLVLSTAMAFAADLAGTWKGAVDTEGGNMEIVLKVEPGSGLTGKINAGPYEAPIENGKVDGDKFSFVMNIEHGKVLYEGTVASDEMKINMTGTTGNKYKLVCKRQK